MKLLYRSVICAMIALTCQQSFAQKMNKALAKELEEIYRADQQYRVAAIAAAKKYGLGSKQDNDLMHKQAEADFVNLAKIERIIAKYGYPGKSMVGAELSKVAFMVVQHNDMEPQVKYLPLFQKAADAGELEKALLPLMIDRIRTAKGQLQLYGTQLHEEGQLVKVFPIEDEPNVNVRRKQAGLPPLENYLAQWHINYKLPASTQNPNPPEMYVNLEKKDENPVEAIGGDAAILNSLHYPDKACEAKVEGYVTVEYTVDADGNTKQVSVVKGLGYGCDEEAIRVIKTAKYINKTGADSEKRMRLPFPYKKKSGV